MTAQYRYLWKLVKLNIIIPDGIMAEADMSTVDMNFCYCFCISY